MFRHAPGLRRKPTGEVRRSSGTLRLGVTGWTTLPTLWPGNAPRVEPATSDAAYPGDMALFVADGRFFVHRVIAKDPADPGIQTRGDFSW
jgi:hypothetical protein